MIVHGHIFNIFMHFWGTFEKAKFRIRGAYVASVLQSSERASFTSWVRIQLGTTGHVKRVKVNALPKVVGFLRVLRFPPTGNVDRGG